MKTKPLVYLRHVEGKVEIMVPELFFYELSNTLITKTGVPENIAVNSLKNVVEAEFKIYHADSKDIIEVTKFAKKYNTSFYDMLYAVIAKIHKTILITADEKFIEKTKFSHVKLLSDYSAGTKI